METIIFRHDAEHGWLEAKETDLLKYGIASSISGCSYQKFIGPDKIVYLEEDCDAGLLLNAMKEAGEQREVKAIYDGDTSPIRYLARYTARKVGF